MPPQGKTSRKFSRQFHQAGVSLKGNPALAQPGSFAAAFDGLNPVGDGQGKATPPAEHAASAFNKSVQTAYLARLDLNMDATARDIAARHPDDPDKFGKSFDEATGNLLKTLPEEWRDSAVSEIESRKGKMMDGIANAALEREMNAANTDLGTAMADYGAKSTQAWGAGDEAGAAEHGQKFLGALDARTDLSAQQKEQARQEFAAQGRRNASLGELDRALRGADGADAAAAFIKDFRDGETIADPVERKKIAAEMQGRLIDAQTKQKAAAAADEAVAQKARAARLDAIDKDITDNQFGLGDLEAQKQSGLFDDDQKTHNQIKQSIIDRDGEAVEKQARLARVSRAQAGSLILDRTDKADRKAVDEAYIDWSQDPKVAALPGPERNALAADLVKKTGIVPNGLQADVRRGLLGNPESQITAADLFMRLEGEGIDAGADLSEHEGARARLITDMNAAGLDPAVIIERADKLTDPANTAQLEGRQRLFKSTHKFSAEDIADNFESWQEQAADGLTIDTPGLSEDANGLFESQFLLTGDEKLSRTYATNTIERTWGPSEADGNKRLMKHPPEAFYSVGEDQSWMAEQLANDIGIVSGEGSGRDFLIGDAGDDEQVAWSIFPPMLRFLAKQWVKKNRLSGRMPRRGNARYKRTNDEKEVVEREDGSVDFGEIDAETAKKIGRESAPIRIERGNKDPDKGKLFGDEHIEDKHGKQIRKIVDDFGEPLFSDVAEYVSYIAENWTEIRENDSGDLVLIVRDPEVTTNSGKHQSMFIELVKAEGSDFYSVKTAGPFKHGYIEKNLKPLLEE